MSRKTATRIGALIGLSAFAALALALYIAGCNNGTTDNDLGLVEPGCRVPSACWTTGADCPCRYLDVNGDTNAGVTPDRVSNATGQLLHGCRTCNPMNGQNCICVMDMTIHPVSQCIEQQEVCVGRAPATCDGVGARCIHAGTNMSCAMSGVGDPPDSVGTGVGGAVETRCPYVDDVCCPGTLAPDGGTLAPDGGTLDGGTLDAGNADASQ